MKIKADWNDYLHHLRLAEIDTIFRDCPKNVFECGLEIGAGDGFLSRILSTYALHLVCTEINEQRLNTQDLPNAEYRVLDAERIGESFDGRTFDFIFSSNLLEHLPDADTALKGIHKVLTDDGITIHVLPNRIWKMTTILCYIPNKIVVTIDKLLAGRLFKRRSGHAFGKPYKKEYGGNNQKIGRRKQSRLTKPFLPPVHGISDNSLEELYVFGQKRWKCRFEKAGFEVVTVRQMPFNSGYGFGFKRIAGLLECLGLSSAAAFVLCKKARQGKYNAYFTDR